MEKGMITFKEMSFPKKAEHIWEYYKLHIIGGIILIISAVSLLNHYIINPEPDVYAGLGFYHTFISDNKIVLLSDTLSEALRDADKNEAVYVYTFFEMEDNIMAGNESDQRFQMLYLGEDMDVIVGEEDAFKDMAFAGYIGELELFLDEEEIEKYAADGKIFRYGNEQSGNAQFNYAVRAENSRVLGLIPDIRDKTLYVGFARNSTRIEKGKKLFYEILK